MNNKMINKKMRSQFSAVGWAILAYHVLIRVCNYLVIYADVIYQSVMSSFTGATKTDIIDNVSGNGWGYLVCNCLPVADP